MPIKPSSKYSSLCANWSVPIYMMIERNMLSLLMNIIRNNTTVEYKILMRQLAMRINEKDHTFINRIQEAIQKYKLEPVEKLMEQPKSKEEWKRIVKSHQIIYWHERCKADQLEKKSLKYLQIQDRPMSKPHNIWQSTVPNQYKVWRDKEQTCDAVIYATKYKIKIQQKYLLHLYTL
jgi:hypothetical protein